MTQCLVVTSLEQHRRHTFYTIIRTRSALEASCLIALYKCTYLLTYSKLVKWEMQCSSVVAEVLIVSKWVNLVCGWLAGWLGRSVMKQFLSAWLLGNYKLSEVETASVIWYEADLNSRLAYPRPRPRPRLAHSRPRPRLGSFKTKTKTKTCLSKTKTKTQQFQHQDQDQDLLIQDRDRDSRLTRPILEVHDWDELWQTKSHGKQTIQHTSSCTQ